MVSPTAYFPPGDISLSDGTTTLSLRLADSRGNPDPRALRVMGMPRTSMQMTQGDPDYGSFVLPYIPVVQKDYSGGRALEDWTKDTTRYYDGDAIDTRLGDAILGPLNTFSFSIPETALTKNYTGTDLYAGAGTPVAVLFTTTSAISVVSAVIRIKGATLSSTTGLIYVKLYSNNAGVPGDLLATSTPKWIANTGSYVATRFRIDCDLSASTSYFIVVECNDDITLDYGALAGTNILWNPGAWVTKEANSCFYFLLEQTDDAVSMIPFEYKGQLFVVVSPEDGSAPQLYQNGYAGLATSNSGALNKTNTTATIPVNLDGYFIKLVSGTGSGEAIAWREITGNTLGANSSISVTPNWKITQDTTTYWSVVGSDHWTEITGHGLTTTITDVLVIDDIIYFCQGDYTAIRRARFASGSWSYAAESDIDATYKGATYMDLIPGTDGKRKVWYAQASTSKVSKSEVKAWGTALVWDPAYASAIVCGNPASKITNVVAYGQPRIPYIMKEDSFGSIANDVYAEVPLSEMNHVKSENNGKAACQFGVYLFFSLMHGVERYYDNRLDDMGPNRDEGFPLLRQGPLSKLLPYPGGIIAAVDGGLSGYSCVMQWNQLGWHEIYRGSQGNRIYDLFVQVIPGNAIDRLWIMEQGNVSYIPIALNPRKQNDYNYTSSGSIITSWYKTQFAEVVKFWKSLTLFTDNLSATKTITAYYQTDTATDDDAWTALSDVYDTSPIQEIDLSATHNVTGKRIRFKLVFATNQSTVSPRLKALTLNAVCRVPQKNTYSYTFTAETAMRDANGQYMDITLDSAMAKLAEWADSNQRAAPLLMRSNLAEVDGGSGRYVFIDPPNKSPVYIEMADGQRQVKYIINLAVYEA